MYEYHLQPALRLFKRPGDVEIQSLAPGPAWTKLFKVDFHHQDLRGVLPCASQLLEVVAGYPIHSAIVAAIQGIPSNFLAFAYHSLLCHCLLDLSLTARSQNAYSEGR